MRILIVCDFFLKYGAQQARSLARMNHDVAILCRSHAFEFGGHPGERDELLTGARLDGVRLFVVPYRIRSSRAVPAVLEIRRALRRWRPDVVQVHRNHDPRLLALTAGYRTVLTVHDPVDHPGAVVLKRWANRADKQWFRRADRFVVHGPALAAELAPLVDPRRIAVIPHGVSPHSEPLPCPESPTVLLFGRLEEYKGVEVLVEATRLVWEQRPDVRLVVAGTGPAARHVPEDPRVLLIPRYIAESEVDDLFAEASLVVLPYTQASQSGVGGLAIAAGVPVVVSNLGALPELAYEPSFTVEAGNPGALADTMLRHLDDGPEVRSAVLRHAQSHFSWDRAARLSTQLYRGLIAQNARDGNHASDRSARRLTSFNERPSNRDVAILPSSARARWYWIPGSRRRRPF
jgi:glycosyltransferase involved in cell wall biosynthesis